VLVHSRTLVSRMRTMRKKDAERVGADAEELDEDEEDKNAEDERIVEDEEDDRVDSDRV